MYVYGTEANLVRTVTRVDRRFDVERKQGPDESTRLDLYAKGRTEPAPVPLRIGDPLLEEIDEFADCVRGARQPETDGRSSLKALALIRAAIESARTGRPADVDNS